MKSCETCYWKRFSLTPPKSYKCKLTPSKRFNKPNLHGWICGGYLTEEEAEKMKIERKMYHGR